MDYTDYLKRLIEYLALPGWRAYAIERAKELDADESGLFTGLLEQLREADRQRRCNERTR